MVSAVRLRCWVTSASAPYDRPPLSKQLLSGRWDVDKTALDTVERLAELDLDLQLGVRATGLDIAEGVIHAGGTKQPFDGLLIATGATPRRLPNQPDLDGMYVLRTLDDALALRGEFQRNPKVVVVGAGFIGAEVAATCARARPRCDDDRSTACSARPCARR